jgi:hypothetical protein
VGNKEMGDTKLLIDEGSTMVKIEVNTVLRGSPAGVKENPQARRSGHARNSAP